MGMKPGDQVEESGKRRRPGGRAAEFVAAVRAATIALLEEQGYERMEIPAIAERAGVNKTSIYRRWPSKAELMLEVALTRLRGDVPTPDTGTLQGDLTIFVRSIAAAIATPLFGGLLQTLMSREHGTITNAVRERFWEERYSRSEPMLRRAIARGEIAATADSRLIVEMAVAPLFFRTLVTGSATTDAEIEEIAERVVAAFRAP